LLNERSVDGAGQIGVAQCYIPHVAEYISFLPHSSESQVRVTVDTEYFEILQPARPSGKLVPLTSGGGFLAPIIGQDMRVLHHFAPVDIGEPLPFWSFERETFVRVTGIR
jgi:hypothetical protein